jgi:molybdate transport system regulatory protein
MGTDEERDSIRFTAKWRLWLEQDGVPFFGDGRARLLQAISATGSLNSAARTTGMAYRTAWRHLNAMEAGLGFELVERHVGGRGGGGCRLTDAGKEFLEGYLRFRADLESLKEKRLAQWDREQRRRKP